MKKQNKDYKKIVESIEKLFDKWEADDGSTWGDEWLVDTIRIKILKRIRVKQ